jgi:hypothetical protein
MKKILLLALMVSFSALAQDFKTPVDYLNYFEKESKAITASTWKYTKAVAHSKSARKIDATRKTLIKSIQAASKKIASAKEGYKGDVEYRDQLLAYYAISEKYINEEYEKIIDMQEVAEQSYDFMEAYILARDLVNKKINDEVEKVNAAQRVFAEKYGITITDDQTEMGKKMAISNEVFNHQSDMYLLFFKVYITDANMMKALEAKDISAMQQNASALEQYADEGLGKLKGLKTYKNDPLLINATKKTLEFYKKEAVEFAPKVADFMLLNQKVEDTRKAIEAKSAPAKDEIASFNKMVADLNKATGEYNKLNNKFFTEKNNVIKGWNTASDSFVSKHVPKD